MGEGGRGCSGGAPRSLQAYLGPRAARAARPRPGHISVILETLRRDQPSLPHGMDPEAGVHSPVSPQDKGADPGVAWDSPAGAPSGSLGPRGSRERCPGPDHFGVGVGGRLNPLLPPPGLLPSPAHMCLFLFGLPAPDPVVFQQASLQPLLLGQEEGRCQGPRAPGLLHLLPWRPGRGERQVAGSASCSQERAGPRPVGVGSAAPPTHLARTLLTWQSCGICLVARWPLSPRAPSLSPVLLPAPP